MLCVTLVVVYTRLCSDIQGRRNREARQLCQAPGLTIIKLQSRAIFKLFFIWICCRERKKPRAGLGFFHSGIPVTDWSTNPFTYLQRRSRCCQTMHFGFQLHGTIHNGFISILKKHSYFFVPELSRDFTRFHEISRDKIEDHYKHFIIDNVSWASRKTEHTGALK